MLEAAYSLLSFLLVYKYLSLFLISLLAALALPLPSSSALAAAGAFSAQGYFDITTVLLVALAGNVAGDMLGYYLSRKYGIKFLKIFKQDKILDTKSYKSFSLYIKHFPHSLIFFSRFLTGVGPLVNVLSGLSDIRFRTFATISVSGEVLYVLMYGLTGYYLGSEWENNLSFMVEASFVVVAFGVLIGLLQYGFYKKMSIR